MDVPKQFVKEMDEMMHFLSLADIREFVYDVDADILESMRYGSKREVHYRGTLDGWAENYKKREGNVNPQFYDFYDAMKRADKTFQHQYDYKGLWRSVKFVTEEKPEGGKIIYGVLMTGQLAGPKEIRYQRATDKDDMLNMLNKKAITEYARRVIAQENCPTTYLVIFDLDHFKMVNDTYGHLYGDEVLVTVTDIINKAVGDHGVVGRIGGDEILIVTKNVADKAELRTILREIRMAVEETYLGRMNGFALTCCMGAAAYPDHGKTYEEVLDIADKMLYLAKEKGRNRYLIYTPEMHHDLIAAPKEAATAARTSFPMAFDKIGIIQYMMEDYLIHGTSSNEAAFSNVGNAFQLGEILIVYEKGRNGFRWTPEMTTHGQEELKWLELDEEFYSRFDKNNLYVIDALYNVEENQKEFLDKLIQKQVETALFYKLCKKGEAMGYIMFAKKLQRQKWSEYELLALSTIAKIFELSVYKG